MSVGTSGPRRRRRLRGGLLSRLLRDTRGNTLILVAASLLPLLCLVGSGIDMGRGYLAQARLQQACDAAALAGRRAMSGGVVDSTVTAEATKFFKFNFPTGQAGVEGSAAFKAKGFTPVVGSAANSTVTVEASTTLPTTVMKMFGFATLPLSVDCFARQDFVNTDIMLVLDTTGSMLCASSESSCTNTSEKSTSKIKGLREAVIALYDQLDATQKTLEAAGLRLRYGVVPYSSSVNVGRLIQQVNASYVESDTAPYQSREPLFHNPRSKTNVTNAACSSTATSTTRTWTASKSGSTTGTCTYTEKTNVQESGGVFANDFNYDQIDQDVSKFVSFSSGSTYPGAAASTPTPTRTPGTTANSKWQGCIEERDTVSTITSSTTGVPSGAYDLDIDAIPSSKATRWVPHWPEVIYYRAGSSPYNGSPYKDNKAITDAWSTAADPSAYYACPSQAVRLKAWTKAQLQSYVDGLDAVGGTYHDIGMLWGTRLLSQAGVFGADNPSTFGNMPVSRHIIFLTDGDMAPNPQTYTSYGVEYLDKRVTGSGTAANQENNHVARFKLICAAARSRGTSIWVIAFALPSGMDQSLKDCAKNDAQVKVADDKQQLIDTFKQIGKNIGALRLVPEE